ncbi:UDP-N-acetylmuramoyl-L-alanine--D-glutamate ligase [Candidatus Saganbacteria bacterium]|nr:UDP-N-acetylmuramoyl-L-alanine--D-glutamate ligase [Candidatus Saganbacteria bacterium]
MTNWNEKNVTVFGLGKSGFATAKKLSSLGAKVLAVEISPAEKTEKSIEKAELIVLSPGIDPDIDILKKARGRNIPVISEIELAFRFFTKPIIAVTGTNGKTTTATLIYEFIKASGRKVSLAGNIGTPLVSIDDTELDFIVAEISSYQLETILTFRPWISVITNLTPDHLTRHKSMGQYASAKARIYLNQRKTDYLVFNAEDPLVVKLIERSEARHVPFSKKYAGEVIPLSISDIEIKGEHNIENAMAAALAAKLAGVSNDVIAKVLREFPGVEHRIEYFIEKKGVKFYNDSKATNPDSTIVALRALRGDQKNIVLILGGRDKNTDLVEMNGLIKETVKTVILIGEASGRFEEGLAKVGFAGIKKASSLEEAVRISYGSASPGDFILLSPACASFDMFKDFEDRGRRFKELVAKL